MQIGELNKSTVQSWRNFLGTEAARLGLLHLLCNRAPSTGGTTPTEALQNASRWAGYVEALADLERYLTKLPERTAPEDEDTLKT